MFQVRDEYFVAGSEVWPAETLCDQVNGLRGAAREYDFSRAGCIDEAAERFAGAFVGVGRPVAQRMHASMDVGMIVALIARHRIDDYRWLLG